jgi:hypothetical protein
MGAVERQSLTRLRFVPIRPGKNGLCPGKSHAKTLSAKHGMMTVFFKIGAWRIQLRQPADRVKTTRIRW